MNTVNRLIAGAVIVLLIAIGVAMLLVLADVISPDEIRGEWLGSRFAGLANATGTDLARNVAIALGLIALGLVLLALEVRDLTERSRDRLIVLSDGSTGSTHISTDSIRELTERTARANRSVHDARCRIYNSESGGGLSVYCAADLTMGSDVPQTTAEIQSSVKEVVERLTGLPVDEVDVEAKYHRGGRDESILAR